MTLLFGGHRLPDLVRKPEVTGDGVTVTAVLEAPGVCNSTVLFVSVCKVTISDYYEPLSFNGITGEKIYRQKITFEHVKTYCSNSQHDYLGCVS